MDLQLPSDGNLLDALLATNEVKGGMAGVIPNASEQQVMAALAAFGRGEIEYVILNDGKRFLQTAGDARSGYVLEYNDGSDKEQFRATQRNISETELASVFGAYLQNDPTWKTQFSWEKFKL